MKLKVLGLTLCMFFFGGIAATSYAQVVATTNSTTVVDNDDDKDKNKNKNKKKKDAKADEMKDSSKMKSCDVKKSCCGSVKLKDEGCKDKKSGKEKK